MVLRVAAYTVSCLKLAIAENPASSSVKSTSLARNEDALVLCKNMVASFM
jgi:hypothetical protein